MSFDLLLRGVVPKVALLVTHCMLKNASFQ